MIICAYAQIGVIARSLARAPQPARARQRHLASSRGLKRALNDDAGKFALASSTGFPSRLERQCVSRGLARALGTRTITLGDS